VACGGAGDESEEETTVDPREPLSAADYRLRAEQACTEAAEELVVTFRDSLTPSSGTPTGEYLLGRAEIRARELEELRALIPPEELRAAAERMIATREEALEELEQARAAAEGGDQAGLDRALPGAELATDEADRAAARLGLEACANRLPAADRRAVERLLRTTATSENPRQLCRELATEAFVAQFGGEEACISGQAESTPARSIEVESLEGVGDVSAQARIELERPGTRLTRFDVTVVWEDGRPKVETIVAVPGQR
jgi:hypothetical protein